MSEHPVTLLGKKLLEDELNHLIRVEREQIKQAIAEARELGDLKENAEYSAAKERQSIIEGRILDLQSKIARGRVVDVSSLQTQKIVFGATVKKISYNSPLGKALIGKEIGDEVTVKAPKGDLMYEVQNIKYN